MKFYHWLILIIVLITFIISIGFFIPNTFHIYSSDFQRATAIVPEPFKVIHIKTPDKVKALYMTNWTAGNERIRNNLINLIDTTELNAIVIDIKDYTGIIGFTVSNKELKKFNSSQNRISDIKEFIGKLHEKGIYVIGRISSFQDSHLVKIHPEYAVKKGDGNVWTDYKGISWLDPGSKDVWEYLALIGEEAYSVGFDELNFDYIRFPSDGNMMDIVYSYSNGKIKSEVMKDFFIFINNKFHSQSIPISADLFGMTTSNNDDLGIGQILENALLYFDFVSPMVYPSHYPSNFNGWRNPSEKPYEIIFYAMSKGIEKAKIAGIEISKLRPWLQDFSINGTRYTSDMIRAEKQAVYDAGLNSWMLWNASNIYTVSALDAEVK